MTPFDVRLLISVQGFEPLKVAGPKDGLESVALGFEANESLVLA
jgi:hypothetical protein